VPAGERSATGIGPIALRGLPGGAVTVVDAPDSDPPEVVVVFEDEFEGDELQAASPNAPARTRADTSAPERGERRGMARDRSRSPQAGQITPLT
jgi:hypothetical protein